MALTPREDDDLRRLHALERFGRLPARMRSRLQDLRNDDQRRDIREPVLDVRWPRQRPDDDMADFEADLR